MKMKMKPKIERTINASQMMEDYWYENDDCYLTTIDVCGHRENPDGGIDAPYVFCVNKKNGKCRVHSISPIYKVAKVTDEYVLACLGYVCDE